MRCYLRFAAFILVCFAAASAHAIDRKVLIIGIDGVRADALAAANTPNIDALIAGGSVGPACQSEDITLSGPCWSTILTGVHRNKHLVVDNTFTPNALTTYPHFFSRLRGACSGVRTASIVHWAPVNTQILQGNADVIQTDLVDDAVRDAAVATIGAGTADVIYLHFDDVDHAGHTYGFSPALPQYIAAIEQEDARVGQIVAAIHARPTYASEDWLIIVVSDHGGSGTSHGQNIPEHRTTTLVVSGASSAIGTTMPVQPTLADIAPTVMTFLGVAINPAWGWDGNAVGLNMAGSTSQPVHCAQRRVLLSENFESVPLGPSVNEAAATGVWSGSPPTGWTVDDSGVPGVNDPNIGVTEWEGWAITSKAWWVSVAQDQNRSQFTRGVGAVAVADPDEWDDRGTPAPSTLGTYNAHLATPAISLAGVAPGSVAVVFDSSWRYEGAQRALLTARFDGGAPVTLLDWRSQAGANFKADATNEAVRVSVANPAGAATMTLDFALLDAGNNWWWAIDNVVVDGGCALAIGSQPAPATSCRSGSATFTVTASGSGPFGYQWRKGTTPINSSLNPSAATAVLMLANVQPGDGGNYDCVVSNACGSIVSNAATLTVSCPNRADIAGLGGMAGCDGQVTVDDLVYYLSQFFANNVGVADLVSLGGGGTADGQITVDDLVAFLAAFFAGCP